MCKAIDAANFFIDLANADPDECMTNLRVNKLLYFAQGWSLVRLGKPLFKDDIQAWKYGPVVPNVYQEYKKYGRERITKTSDDYSADKFSSDELELLLDVAREYGKYSSSGLVAMTHEKNTPWSLVYSPAEYSSIDNDSLKKYFSTQPSLKEFVVPDLPEAGYRDEVTGNYVLPNDWNDEDD